jgi:hypothetical protein
MTNQELIKAKMQREANEYSELYSDYEGSFYIAGAASCEEILLKLVEACEDYKHISIQEGNSPTRYSSAAEALSAFREWAEK